MEALPKLAIPAAPVWIICAPAWPTQKKSGGRQPQMSPLPWGRSLSSAARHGWRMRAVCQWRRKEYEPLPTRLAYAGDTKAFARCESTIAPLLSYCVQETARRAEWPANCPDWSHETPAQGRSSGSSRPRPSPPWRYVCGWP